MRPAMTSRFGTLCLLIIVHAPWNYAPLVAAIERLHLELLPWEVAEAKAAETVAQMTPEELYSLVRGIGWQKWKPYEPFPGFLPNKSYYIGNTPAIPRLGIPALKIHDAANGFRTTPDIPLGSTTQYPSMLALAATWNEKLVEEVAAAIAKEFRGKGANMLLGPSVQVHRIFLGGRNFEYMSGDDPYLGARLARAYVIGAQSEGVIATAKHFAFNEQETSRFSYNIQVDERTAWELYYPPFEAAVEAGVGAVMCAYNKVNGTHACSNSDLLQRDLKQRMGFRGFVQADWGAAYNYSKAIESGLDQNMPGSEGLFSDETLASLRPGAVEGAAKRVLTSIYRSRLHEQPSCTPPNCELERMSYQRVQEHRALARSAAIESVTLLFNHGNILPLTKSKVKRIAVVGEMSNYIGYPQGGLAPDKFPSFDHLSGDAYAGGGSGHVMPGSVVTPLQAITYRAMWAGMTVISSPTNDAEMAKEVARDSDVVVFIAGHSCGEGADRNRAEDHFGDLWRLATGGDDLIASVADIKPTIVLMQLPGGIFMPFLRNKVAALAVLFLGGEETGFAWSNLLFGDISPQGKLPIAFPRALPDTINPVDTMNISYDEGLFTSYRDASKDFVFPFGHGLSYTQFELGAPEVIEGDACNATACVALTVTNVGDLSGTEVVQAYMQFVSAEKTPERILRGFHKTRYLKPQEVERAVFNFRDRDLSIYTVDRGWVVQDRVTVHIGVSSKDIRHVVSLFGQRTIEL